GAARKVVRSHLERREERRQSGATQMSGAPALAAGESPRGNRGGSEAQHSKYEVRSQKYVVLQTSYFRLRTCGVLFRRLRRPNSTLVFTLRDALHSFIEEALQTPAVVGLGRV